MDEDFTGFAFERFNLSCGLLKGIFEKGWESPIQEASLEVALSGNFSN
jgi:hypothetical protein